MNNVNLIGNLTADPEMKISQNNKGYCNFTIAINDGWGDNKKVHFINCVTWNKQAESLVQYCNKGSRIAISGKLDQSTWEDRDGNKRSAIKVVALQIQFLTQKNKEEGTAKQVQNMFTEDIPF